jgi:hypothetical protein
MRFDIINELGNNTMQKSDWNGSCTNLSDRGGGYVVVSIILRHPFLVRQTRHSPFDVVHLRRRLSLASLSIVELRRL